MPMLDVLPTEPHRFLLTTNATYIPFLRNLNDNTMARIFNSIRQRLLKENRFTRYLVYAVGEIVLVVIGILIALQLNNWNNHRQVKQLEVTYLKEIDKHLMMDSVDVQFNIAFNQVRLRAGQMVLQCLYEHEVYSDTMDQHFGNLHYTTRSVMNFSAYETLKARGLDIISDDPLRMMIAELYSFYYHNVIDFEQQDDHLLQYTVVMPAVVGKLVMHPSPNSRMELASASPKDFASLKGDDAFKNAVILNNDLRAYMLSNYHELAEKVAACRRSIHIQLERLEH